MTYILEILIIISTIGAWIQMFRSGGESPFSRRGLASLKYYTTLSNIFAGMVSFLTILYFLLSGTGLLPLWLSVLKYAAAVSLGLTFLVTLFFLTPQMGFAALYKNELLFLHAIGPLLVIISFILRQDLARMSRSTSFFAVLPTILYGTAYAVNIFKNGIGEGEETNDWYGFAIGGVKSVPIAFVIIVALTWMMALGMLALAQ